MLLAGAVTLISAQALIASKINDMEGAHLLLDGIIQCNTHKKMSVIRHGRHVTVLV